jgi:hypothetical protein
LSSTPTPSSTLPAIAAASTTVPAAPPTPTGFCIGTSEVTSSGPSARAAPTMVSRRTAMSNQRTARHRGEKGRPSGNTSGRRRATPPSHRYSTHDVVHPASKAPARSESRAYDWVIPDSMNVRAVPSSTQPTAFRGCREATRAPTSAQPSTSGPPPWSPCGSGTRTKARMPPPTYTPNSPQASDRAACASVTAPPSAGGSDAGGRRGRRRDLLAPAASDAPIRRHTRGPPCKNRYGRRAQRVIS